MNLPLLSTTDLITSSPLLRYRGLHNSPCWLRESRNEMSVVHRSPAMHTTSTSSLIPKWLSAITCKIQQRKKKVEKKGNKKKLITQPWCSMLVTVQELFPTGFLFAKRRAAPGLLKRKRRTWIRVKSDGPGVARASGNTPLKVLHVASGLLWNLWTIHGTRNGKSAGSAEKPAGRVSKRLHACQWRLSGAGCTVRRSAISNGNAFARCVWKWSLWFG